MCIRDRQGIEDIRLYEYEGHLRFIATQRQFSPTLQNRMIKGIIDLDTYRYKECKILEPPEPTFCEKNWIPLPEIGEDAFIYKWYPYQIGRLDDKNKLNIFLEKEMPPYFENIRGSTICQKRKINVEDI